MLIHHFVKKEAMDYCRYNISSATVSVASFRAASGSGEYHVMVTSLLRGAPFSRQLRSVVDALSSLELPDGCRLVFKRFFLSDPANQSALLDDNSCAVSVIGESPLDGSKVALWAMFQEGVDVKKLGGGYWEVKRGAYRHLWCASMHPAARNTHNATVDCLSDFSRRLSESGCNMRDNAVRTWFFVRDIDTNYSGVVSGRNEVFRSEGLTENTRFIASTGIGGIPSSATDPLSFDAYAVAPLLPGQLRHVKAFTHLNPTMEYGVAFERGSYIDYGDRRHLFISGTASIDHRGLIVHSGDIEAQTRRMWENVGALLDEGGCRWDDVAYAIVYIRDIADHIVVRNMMEERFPKLPYVIVLAPVCRPGWLIEMECMAICPAVNEEYAPF